MSKLTEHKSDHYHYYLDDQGRFQGEYKSWYYDGKLQVHCFYKDNIHNGEFKWLKLYDELIHEFYQDYKNITYAVKELVDDINNITKEERMMLKLKFGIDCISKEITCHN